MQQILLRAQLWFQLFWYNFMIHNQTSTQKRAPPYLDLYLLRNNKELNHTFKSMCHKLQKFQGAWKVAIRKYILGYKQKIHKDHKVYINISKAVFILHFKKLKWFLRHFQNRTYWKCQKLQALKKKIQFHSEGSRWKIIQFNNELTFH